MSDITDNTLTNIKNLQEMEQSLYANLEHQLGSSHPPSIADQKKLVKRINDMSNMRAALFDNLQEVYADSQTQVASTRTGLVNELTAVKVVEEELNNSKTQLNSIKREKQDALRMVEINTYYGKRYQAHTDIVKIIIIACLPILLFIILNKKGLLSSNITNILIGIVIVILIIILWYRIGDLMFRDNMNYDQYNYPFDPKDVNIDTTTDSSSITSLPKPIDLSIECVGDECCPSDNMRYDKASNICVIDTDATKTSSDAAIMTKETFALLDDNTKLKGGTNIQPYSEENSFVKI